MAFKERARKKRRVGVNRSPALKAAPDAMIKLLELVNLLPPRLRNPWWARTNEPLPEPSRFDHYKRDILDWRSGGESIEARLIRWIGEDVPEEWAINTPALLWRKLRNAISELPLALQAFVLQDQTERFEVDSDIQALLNFELIRKDEQELKDLINEASGRIDEIFVLEKEEQLQFAVTPGGPGLTPDTLVMRARQRLIFVLAVQELVSCIAHPERKLELYFCSIYRRSDAAQSRLYITREGKLAFTDPALFVHLKGVEATRIRECPICRNFFWAGRADKRGCSDKCSKVLRSREWRERYPEKYKHRSYLMAEARAKKPEATKKRK